MTLRENQHRPVEPDALSDRTAGLLLTAAGWAGGGVLSAVVFQGPRSGVDPTLDPFASVVAGCLLVGPVGAAALLWQWKQVRMVSTVTSLTAVGVLAAVPVIAGARALAAGGQAATAIALFVALWGVALPMIVRAAILHVDHPWLAGDPDPLDAGEPWFKPTARSSGSDLASSSAIGFDFGATTAGPTAFHPDRGGPWAPRPGSAPPGPPVDDRLPPVRLPSR